MKTSLPFSLSLSLCVCVCVCVYYTAVLYTKVSFYMYSVLER